MSATYSPDCSGNTSTLFVAFELGWGKWKMAFGTRPGGRTFQRTINARDVNAVLREIGRAKQQLGLGEDAAVVSCYEAGRDGFWLHRCLRDQGIGNMVVDSSSIEVNRRARRAKSDGLDAGKLLTMLMRHGLGESNVWSIVNVPSVKDEDWRQLHRELMALKSERTRHVNRIKGLLAGCGLKIEVGRDLPQVLTALRTWDDAPLGDRLHQRVLREFERMQLAACQIRDLENERARVIRTAEDANVVKVRKLSAVRGIGANSAWLYVMEFFGWRKIQNRRELGALAGLTPTPYQSGGSERELGISKAGNRRIRAMAIEIAWGWLRFQPQSELSQWFQRRFGEGSSRLRKIGIVAMARKLLIQLWRYVETGTLPCGALLKG